MTMNVSETFCPENSHRQAKVHIRILSAFCTSFVKNFVKPVLDQKRSLNNMDLKGSKILTYSEVPHVCDRPWKWHSCSHLRRQSGEILNT
jgi:hypothetical protein